MVSCHGGADTVVCVARCAVCATDGTAASAGVPVAAATAAVRDGVNAGADGTGFAVALPLDRVNPRAASNAARAGLTAPLAIRDGGAMLVAAGGAALRRAAGRVAAVAGADAGCGGTAPAASSGSGRNASIRSSVIEKPDGLVPVRH